MSFKFTAVLLVLLAMLAGGAYVLQKSKPKPPSNAPQYLYKYQYEDIVRIDIDLTEKSLHIKQVKVGDQEQWQFADGDNANADAANAGNIQLIMSGPAYGRIISEGPIAADKLNEYGFGKPSITATITLKNGLVHKVFMGDKTPDGKFHYAKNADSDTIYLIDKVWGDELSRVVNNPPVPTPSPEPSPTATATATSS